MKTLYGLSWRAFHRCTCMGPARGLHPIPVRGRHITLPLFARDSTAFRFPAILFSGLLIAMVYLLARRFVPRPAAAAGAVLALAQPHYFFHAPIACFDAPITTMAFAVGFAYWKSLRSTRWGIACGVVWGIALGTKHNAWFMPVFLAAHYLWIGATTSCATTARRASRWRSCRWRCWGRRSSSRTGRGCGPPRWRACRCIFNRHLQHEHYNFEYLGLNWNNPPTDLAHKLIRTTFPFMSTSLTVPVTTLALAIWGGRLLPSRGAAARARAVGGWSWRPCPRRRPPGGARRAGCAREPTSTARPARFSRRRSSARCACWRCRRRRSSAA